MDRVTENLRNAEMRHQLEQKYTTSRLNLLLLMIFTTVNVVMLLTKSFTYFLFSASIPYFLVNLGMLVCGLYDPEYYIQEGLVGMEFVDSSFLVVMTVIAALILIAYLACFFFSKNMNGGWLIVALVLFGIDTLGMFALYDISADMLIDILFHIWVIYYLVLGISAWRKMKTVPVQHFTEEELLMVNENGERYDSTPLRTADMSTKSRTFLAANELGHTIEYRRVKKTNELLIDGRVYDEYTALMEFPHTLIAVIDGHIISAGINSSSRMFITVDGNVVANKVRIF